MSKRRREKNDTNLRTDQAPGLAKKIKISTRTLRSHKQDTKRETSSAFSTYVSPECRGKLHPGLASGQSPVCSTPRARRYRLNASHSESETEIIWDGNSPTAHLQRRIGQNGRSKAGDVLEIVQCVNNQMHNIDDRPDDMPLLGLWMNRSPHHPAVDLCAVGKTQAPFQHESSKPKMSNGKKMTHKKTARLSVLQAEIEKIANAVAMAPTNDAVPRQRSSPESDVDGQSSVLPSGQEPVSEENDLLEPQLVKEPVDAKISSEHVNRPPALDQRTKTSQSVAGQSNVDQSVVAQSGHDKIGRPFGVSHQLNTGWAGSGQPKKSASGQLNNVWSVGGGQPKNGSLVNSRSDASQFVSGLPTTSQSVDHTLRMNKLICQPSTGQTARGSAGISHPVTGQSRASRSVSNRSNSGQSTLCRANSGQSNTHQSVSNQPRVTQSINRNSVVPSPTAPVQSQVEADAIEWDDDSYFEDEAVLEQLSQTEALEISKQIKKSDAKHERSSAVVPNVSKPALTPGRVTVSKTQHSVQDQQAKVPINKNGSSNPVGRMDQQDGCNRRAPVPKPPTESKKLFVPVPRPSRSSAAVANSISQKQPLALTSKPIMDSEKDIKNQGASDPSQPADGLDWDSLDLFESSLTDEMMMALCDGMDSPQRSKMPGQESLLQDSKSTSFTSAPTSHQRNGFAQQQDNVSTSSIRMTRQSSVVQGIKTATRTTSLSDKPDKTQSWQQSNKFSFSNKTQAPSSMTRDHKPSKTTTTITAANSANESQGHPNNSTSWNKSEPQKISNPQVGSGSSSFTFRRPTKEKSNAANLHTSSYAPVGQMVLTSIPNRQPTSTNTKAAGNGSRFQPVPTFVNQQPKSSQPAYASTIQTTVQTRDCKASAPAQGKNKQVGGFGNSLVTAEGRSATAAISITHASGMHQRASSSTVTPTSAGSQQFCSQLEIEKKRQQALARRQRKL